MGLPSHSLDAKNQSQHHRASLTSGPQPCSPSQQPPAFQSVARGRHCRKRDLLMSLEHYTLHTAHCKKKVQPQSADSDLSDLGFSVLLPGQPIARRSMQIFQEQKRTRTGIRRSLPLLQRPIAVLLRPLLLLRASVVQRISCWQQLLETNTRRF